MAVGGMYLYFRNKFVLTYKIVKKIKITGLKIYEIVNAFSENTMNDSSSSLIPVKKQTNDTLNPLLN
jgi:hypothetical protein